MLYEGIKETENTRIERDDETKEEIEMLYAFEVVIFEHVILESGKYSYSICYFAPREVFDIVIEDKNNNTRSFETMGKLNERMDKLFQLNKGDNISIDDEDINCISHSVEYTL